MYIPLQGGTHNNNGNTVDTIFLNDPNIIFLNIPRSPTHFNASNGIFSTILILSSFLFI